MPSTFTLLCGALLIATLVSLALIDQRTGRLPNGLTIPLTAAGLIWASVASLDLYPHILGAALGYGAFWAVEVIYRWRTARDGLGRGDAKLLMAGGAWCGAIALPALVLIASVSALAVVYSQGLGRTTRLPFGPYLALAIGGVWIVQQAF